jgi:signal transduction histidine kinase
MSGSVIAEDRLAQEMNRTGLPEMDWETGWKGIGRHMAMQQEMKQAAEQLIATERKRVEAVVETLATLRCEGESLAELAHDARNMVTALGLYCDLLEEPGVLATEYAHYGSELRLVAAASRRLVEKLVALDVRGNAARGTAERRAAARNGQAATLQAARLQDPRIQDPQIQTPRIQEAQIQDQNETPVKQVAGVGVAASQADTGAGKGIVNGLGAGFGINSAMSGAQSGHWDLMPPELISNLAQELIASRNLLSALAGPTIALTVDVEGGALPVRLNAEDLTRVLVNLVKNAAEAMPKGGSIRVGLRKRGGPAEGTLEAAGTGQELSLTIEDTGSGIPRKALERVFEAGFTTRPPGNSAENSAGGGWPSAHRGLGLSITRSIVEAAGGRTYATNREGPGTPGRGARFEIVLPVRSR